MLKSTISYITDFKPQPFDHIFQAMDFALCNLFSGLIQLSGLLGGRLIIAVNDFEPLLVKEVGVDLAGQLALLLVEVIGIGFLAEKDQPSLFVNAIIPVPFLPPP